MLPGADALRDSLRAFPCRAALVPEPRRSLWLEPHFAAASRLPTRGLLPVPSLETPRDLRASFVAPEPFAPPTFLPPTYPPRQNTRRQTHPAPARVPQQPAPLPASQTLACIQPPRSACAARLPKVPAPLPPPKGPSSASPTKPAARKVA